MRAGLSLLVRESCILVDTQELACLASFSQLLGIRRLTLACLSPPLCCSHTSRFMMIWLTLLPFTLWDNCGWAMLPITFIVSFLLLGEHPAAA